jgi:hypothetical protein
MSENKIILCGFILTVIIAMLGTVVITISKVEKSVVKSDMITLSPVK